MNTIEYTLYELETSHPLNARSPSLKRQGALLKMHFSSEKIGYADCHPWPELGDLPLKEQLQLLAQKQFTPLTRCAMDFALLDAEARMNKTSLLNNLCIPRSHLLMTHFLDRTPSSIQKVMDRGFTHVKLKMGFALDQEIQMLHDCFQHSPLQLRLDFNETLTAKNFSHFLKSIEKLRHLIDFIEDPFPFDSKEWAVIQEDGWKLASDRQASLACHQPEAAHFLIIKPAFQRSHLWQQSTHQTRLITSYLGHPLEQMAAAFIASKVDPSCRFVHGLLSHHAYSPTSFSAYLNWQNSEFISSPGNGFGFDEELQNLEWKVLQ